MHPVLKLIQTRPRHADDGLAADGEQRRVTSLPGTTPLVLDSPHSGTFYPADFRPVCDLLTLRRAEDTHVEKLYAFAPELGVAWVEAHFPRSYLDANRDTTELDTTLLDGPWHGPLATDPRVLAKVRLGKGLIWKLTDEGLPIYDRLLGVDEVAARIAHCWVPYHAAVAEAIDAAHARHGYSIHINCHSMPAIAGSHATDFPGLAHADFVIGDRDGTTASPALSQALCAHLRSRGYSVDYNHPYKGVELVRRHGHPAANRHSIQVEINRRLYMDEATLALDEVGAFELQESLRSMVDLLLATDPR
ncbi:N-formylglutamate amidohydrolase [Variovorax ginsengisoli]|uniref:N-formylglutamate deformylase n=1 Tax=Variovorax ginsengisoli TaxID=363844 RepID=A0ABT9S750_9BURK|nr:N-formylglutamate amidohydrolase [Variovorax ginsengisoli]MDP9900193.1 N-formylglutamate deformylase [Variovorax ginsengisoli]